VNPNADSASVQLAFLAGVPRAGITWLSRALNRHPEVAVFGQSRFWGKHYIEPDAQGLYGSREQRRLIAKINAFEWNATVGRAPGCLAGLSLPQFRALLVSAVESLDTPATPATVYAALSAAVAHSQKASIVIEKTPHHVLYADRIVRAFPAARLLLLHCPPFPHMAALKGQRDLRYHPLAAALIWRKYDAAIRACAKRFRANTTVVGVMSLAHEPHQTLQSLGKELGTAEFDWLGGMPPFDFGLPHGQLPQLDAADAFWMGHINRGAAGMTGAIAPPGLPVLKSLLTLPAYALHNLNVARREVEGSLFDYYRRWFSAGAG
jgi:hypothetical protein